MAPLARCDFFHVVPVLTGCGLVVPVLTVLTVLTGLVLPGDVLDSRLQA